MHDIVIRGGRVIDGSGAPAFTGDIAIAGGRIAAVGGKQGPARREIDADGLLVTPGWVDVHTHYDGQAMWETCNSLWAAVQSGTNLVYHAAGWLEGGLASGYEKFVMDADQLGMMQVLAKNVDLSENGQALDAIRETVRTQARPMKTTHVKPWYRRRVIGALARRMVARLAAI